MRNARMSPGSVKASGHTGAGSPGSPGYLADEQLEDWVMRAPDLERIPRRTGKGEGGIATSPCGAAENPDFGRTRHFDVEPAAQKRI